MNVSKKCFLFGVGLLALGLAGGIYLLIALEKFRPRSSVVDDSASPIPSNTSAPFVSHTEKSQLGPGVDAWKSPGQQWRLRVKKYSGPNYGSALPKIYREAMGVEDKSILQQDFTMRVRVLPLRHHDDHDIARFQFLPGDKVPKEYIDHLRGAKYILEVDLHTAQVVRLQPEPSGPFVQDSFGEERFLKTQLWFPVDWMLRNTDLATMPAAKTYMTPTRDDQKKPNEFVKSLEPVSVPSRSPGASAKTQRAVHVELTARHGGRYRLVQVWVPGEPWWRSFQRYYGDQLDLEAFWVEDE